MANPKIRTYAEKLLEDKDFNTAFQDEYKKLVMSERVAGSRYRDKQMKETGDASLRSA